MMFQKKFLEVNIYNFQLKSLCLSETSFSDLNDLTFNCLLECNNGTNDETEFEEVRLITKSLFFYYKYYRFNEGLIVTKSRNSCIKR